MADLSTPEQTAKEYGQYVALVPIDVAGVLAFAPGDPVPASTVAAHPEWKKPGEGGVPQFVAGVNTKAAAEV
jgi:hypothetical protein